VAHAVRTLVITGTIVFASVATIAFRQASPSARAQTAATGPFDSTITQNAQRMIEEGRRVFRYDTFGDEALRFACSGWTWTSKSKARTG
jgi:hypothetical protein